jgi:hypothetical protein
MLNLLADPKKAATLIIAEGKKPSADIEKGDDYQEESGNEFEVGLKQSAKILMQAIEQKDVSKFVSEFKNMMQMCSMYEMDEMGED